MPKPFMQAYSFICLFLVMSAVLNSTAFANSPAPLKENLEQKILPGAQKLGSGRLTFFGWSIYQASLYSFEKKISFNSPFLLSIEYDRPVKGMQIAKKSIEAIRYLGFDNEYHLASWYAQMRLIFPDVTKGTHLIGLYMPKQGVRFYHGSKPIGMIKDTQFASWFFNIWLSEKTKLKGLRRQLLGMK